MRRSMRITATALALVMGFIGAAQAENFNIFSVSKAQQAAENGTVDQVRRVYRGGGPGIRAGRWAGGRYGYRGGRYGYYGRRYYPGVGLAVGAAAAAAGSAYYNCDPYYENCGPRYYRRGYYAPRTYAPRRVYRYR